MTSRDQGKHTTRPGSMPRRDALKWPVGGLRGQTVDQALEVLSKSFHEAGEIAAERGLLACFEIEPVFVFNREEHYLRILQGANHPALKGIYDPSHFDQMNGATGKPE